jgi:plastocyanin
MLVGTCVSALAAATLTGCGSRVELGPVANARTASEIRTALGGSSESGGSEAAVSTGTGWATLRGRFVYGATPPQMAPYNVTKEQAICSPGGRAPLQETLLVDSGTGGIQNVAVYLRDATRVHESVEPGDRSAVFDQKACVFLTHVLAVTVGQTVEIKNSDDTGHNTNVSGKNKMNPTVPAHGSIPFVPQKEEALPAKVTCSIHPWMVAYLLPRENGYYAVTGQDGSFEIANLPAGEELEIQVWHESGTGPGSALVVNTPEAKALGWSNKGRFTVTLQPDEVKEVQITVPASAFSG